MNAMPDWNEDDPGIRTMRYFQDEMDQKSRKEFLRDYKIPNNVVLSILSISLTSFRHLVIKY